ncbi:hypothetical protein WOC76_09490 [Methylocystis sp. IM3]|jgi:hypothetical protein|uniref:hypothetical protein n=1 Tax=unclassified Methylocystis TaxID=2625913 RepID=UPI000F91FA3C|nr:MAG: hypothetical protein EKK29_09665 [Hyphomicrobiales bacterium]
MSYVIASADGVAVIVDVDGNVATIDSTFGPPDVFGKLEPKPVLPISIAASAGGGVETCVVVDAVGNCWRGPIRREAGRSFSHIGKLPERSQS